MPRPRKRRCIRFNPPAVFYKPQGVPLGELRGVTLCTDGLEAMRLVDAQGLSQEQAAALMEVSRPTLCRMLAEARAAVARALANGWAIRIEDRLAAEQGPPGMPRRGGRQRRGRGCDSSGVGERPQTREEQS
jgi:uncharacterized protein